MYPILRQSHNIILATPLVDDETTRVTPGFSQVLAGLIDAGMNVIRSVVRTGASRM